MRSLEFRPDDMIVLIASLAVAFVVIVLVIRFVYQPYLRRRQRAALPDPQALAPPDPWIRFACALAAPYARFEWERTDLPMAEADDTYAGFATAGSVETRQALHRDWDVVDRESAYQEAFSGAERISGATQVVVALTSTIDAADVRGRLERAGASPQTRHRLLFACFGSDGEAHDDADALTDEERALIGEPELADELTDEFDIGPDDVSHQRDVLAADIARYVNLVRWATSIGFIDPDDAESIVAGMAACAVTVFGDWEEYGERFIAGLEAYDFGLIAQRRDVITWLTTDPGSPWARIAWPA